MEWIFGVINLENKGIIYRVSGPVVTVLNLDAKMNELVKVGQEGLFGEVIEIENEKTIDYCASCA